MTQAQLRLVVGLGNPGAEYAETRHNAGFWFCERLARELKVDFARESRFHGWVAHLRESDVRLLMPTTFMNHSGQAARALAQFYRIAPEEILVVLDELDLPPGQMRLKFGGSAGSSNGLKDVSAHLGDTGFWRLRIGIGHPGDRSEVINYVLKPPRKEEAEQIDAALDRALAAWPLLAHGEFNAALQKINAKAPPAGAPAT